uniref:hypothetical protein n=1 Tax=Aphanocladia delicatula TaxID=3041656 RepID=UPI002551F3BA|nr:hypothetical protein QQP87_pgp116 [Aphanocladia delicatula]WGH14146.1 hypothetical protein [Aphanocladia delicatula]
MNFLHYISYISYINLENKIFYKQYIYLIIKFTFALLIILPYLSTNTLIILILFVTLIFIVLLKNLYINKFFIKLQEIFRIFLYTLLINHITNENNFNKLAISYISFTYYLRIISLIYKKKSIVQLYFYSMSYKISNYLKKFFIINTAYILLFHSISIFIRNEVINKTLLTAYIGINKLNLSLYNISILNIMINNQILEKVIENMNNIHLGTKIKTNNILAKELIKNINFYTKKFFNQLLRDENDINITLWIKFISNKFYKKIYID